MVPPDQPPVCLADVVLGRFSWYPEQFVEISGTLHLYDPPCAANLTCITLSLLCRNFLFITIPLHQTILAPFVLLPVRGAHHFFCGNSAPGPTTLHLGEVHTQLFGLLPRGVRSVRLFSSRQVGATAYRSVARPATLAALLAATQLGIDSRCWSCLPLCSSGRPDSRSRWALRLLPYRGTSPQGNDIQVGFQTVFSFREL